MMTKTELADEDNNLTPLKQPSDVLSNHGEEIEKIVAISSKTSKNPHEYDHLYPQLIATCIISWLAIINGYASAYTAPAEISMGHDLDATKDQIGWIVSLLPVGALIGSLSGGLMFEYFGRKHTLFLMNIVFLISWIMNYLATDYRHLYASRFFSGCAVGITSFAIPVYLAETVQAKIRGRLGLFPTVFGNLGILLCFALGIRLKWKSLALFGVILSVPFLITAWFIPDTPRWYFSKNRPEEATKALRWFRGQHCDITKELGELLHPRHTSNTKQPIFTRVHVKGLAIVLGLMFFQQFSGINAIISYTTEIFEETGSNLNSYVCTAIVGLVNFLSVFIATVLVDHLGRKKLMYFSAGVMSATLFAMGLYFFLLASKPEYDLSPYSSLPLLSLILYVLGFSLGLGPIPWLMMSELFPPKIRGHASSFSAAFNWACTFIITKFFPILEDHVGIHWIFWFFGLMMVCCLLFLYWFVPETKKRTLEDIELELGGHKRPR